MPGPGKISGQDFEGQAGFTLLAGSDAGFALGQLRSDFKPGSKSFTAYQTAVAAGGNAATRPEAKPGLLATFPDTIARNGYQLYRLTIDLGIVNVQLQAARMPVAQIAITGGFALNHDVQRLAVGAGHAERKRALAG